MSRRPGAPGPRCPSSGRQLVSGAVVTETVFALPGVGSLIVQSVLKRDYPVIQGIMFTVAVLYVVINFATDLSYALLDPRIRYR